MNNKIFLTGGSGFIGSKFLDEALKVGCDVRVLSRKPKLCEQGKSLEVYQGDLTDECDWTLALSGVDVVVNTAGEVQNKDAMQSVNFEGPLRLLNAAIEAGVRRWVQLSSVGAYGRVLKGVVDEDWNDCPAGHYEKTKSDFDLALIEASRLTSLEVCIVRPSNVYGSGMSNQSIEQMLSVMRKNLFAFIGPKGASANYVHVNDVVQAIQLCIDSPKAINQIYIVSAWATMEDMVLGLANGAGLEPPAKRVPLQLAHGLASVMQFWSKWPLTTSRVQAMSLKSQYSTKKIERELGFRLTVPVKEGMRHFARGVCQ
ncbi:NAD-dependent epimerase/dehydratase family protein [Alphaproteobacteria bacterium]|nr:NAD-dependent epimerase/dehydratase family protein [Alphaproteobacteria bacterium]